MANLMAPVHVYLTMWIQELIIAPYVTTNAWNVLLMIKQTAHVKFLYL